MDLKNDKELAELSIDELAGYYNTLNEAKNSEIEEAIKAKSSKEEVAKLFNSYKKDTEEQVEKMNAILIEQGLKLKRMSEVSDNETILVRPKSLKKSLTEKRDNLKGLKGSLSEARDNEFSIGINTPMNTKATMAYSANPASAPLGELPQSYREPGIYDLRRSILGFLPYVQQTPIASNVVSYVSKSARTNNASATAETSAKPESDFVLTVTSKFVIKYANYIKVSTEMLDDISFLESEINNELIGNVLEDVDKDCFTGNGTTELEGILTSGQTFGAGNFSGTVTAPNILDVLTVAMSQMESLYYYKASAIFMNPEDVTKLRLVKDTDQNYMNRLIVTADSMSVGSVPIYTSTHIGADKYAVVDMSQIRMYIKEDMNLEFGMENDDFTKNLRTILTEWRGVLRIANSKAIIHGDFSDDIAELATS